jgi:hypothetical protein
MKDHLRRIADLRVPIYVIYNKGGDKISGCRLVFDDDLLLICGISENVPIIGTSISASYDLDVCSCTFQAKVMTSIKKALSEVTISLELPKRIAKIEKRKTLRVNCLDADLVTVGVTMRGKTIRVHAFDISRSGIGLILPGSLSCTARENIGLEIDLPKMCRIKVSGKIVFLRQMIDQARLGIKFEHISEDNENAIGQYVHLQTLRLRKRSSSAKGEQESIFVIKQVFGAETRLFVCSDLPMDDINDFAAFSEIACMSVADSVRQ